MCDDRPHFFWGGVGFIYLKIININIVYFSKVYLQNFLKLCVAMAPRAICFCGSDCRRLEHCDLPRDNLQGKHFTHARTHTHKHTHTHTWCASIFRVITSHIGILQAYLVFLTDVSIKHGRVNQTCKFLIS